MNTIKFKLQGLNCEACVKISTMKLKKVSGVNNVRIDLATGQAEIDSDKDIKIQELNQALSGTDFKVTE